METRIHPTSKFHKNELHIVCAANKVGDTGLILVGTRHWDSLMTAQWRVVKGLPEFKEVTYDNIEQGFLDRNRNFLTREEAYQRVIETGQPVVGEDWGELYSENLY
jgi:hypothetical protein